MKPKKSKYNADIPFNDGSYQVIVDGGSKFNSSSTISKSSFFENNTNPSSTHLPSLCLVNGTIENIHKQLDIQGFDTLDIDQVFSSLPLFKDVYKIKIPNKVYRALERYYKQENLEKVHSDKLTAIELCLLFLTNLNDTYYRSQKNCIFGEQGWKTLYSKILQNQLMHTDRTYLDIIECLQQTTKKGAIIERSSNYDPVAHYSYKYRLTDAYRNKGWSNYTLTTEVAKKLQKRIYLHKFKQAMENPIAKNLISIYPFIELPTSEQIKTKAKELVKAEHHSKKGKKLVFRNKHADSYFKNPEELSFVEDDMQLWNDLFENGEINLIPMVTGENNGGRVVDGFTLAPSWIRNMIKINGQTLEELDYSALHPNIAAHLYDGKMKYITHDKVAEETGLDKKEVKKEHLSFFNKEVSHMSLSPLFEYYNKKDRNMVTKIINDKFITERKHKITSQKMFKKEVEIMSDVIQILNNEGIYVVYIYDALMCEPEFRERVLQVMNDVVIKHGVYTTAK